MAEIKINQLQNSPVSELNFTLEFPHLARGN